MIAVMSVVMLTGCGSASIAPLDYLTDDIVDINDLPAYPTRPKDVRNDNFLIITTDDFNATDLHDEHEFIRIEPQWRAGEDSKNPDGYAYFWTGIPELYIEMHKHPDGTVFLEQEATRYLDGAYYIGILSTTNLGAPLTENPATAIWSGYFSGGNINRREITYFYVDVESGQFGFHNGMDGDDSGIGIVNDPLGGFGISGPVIHELNGYFGNHPKAAGLNPGQVVGTVDVNYDFEQTFFNEGQATLTGLIGEEGIVGVFRKFGEDGFSGGFTATNPSYTPPAGLPDPCADGIEGACVDYADWADSFLTPLPTAPNTTPVNQFLSGDASEFNRTLNLKDAINRKTHNPEALNGNDNSGVAYFKDHITFYSYAGLLSGTNLGAPLIEESGNAEWVGRMTTGGQRFTLEIDFASKKIEAFPSFYNFASKKTEPYYHIVGNYDENGVITGTVNRGRLDADTLKPIEGEPRHPAVLTGLIGQNGAVGVFISGTGDKNGIIGGADNFGYAGGFVAHPYGN